jgi:hypothetical protein
MSDDDKYGIVGILWIGMLSFFGAFFSSTGMPYGVGIALTVLLSTLIAGVIIFKWT